MLKILSKIKLLMWKNFVLQKRHPFQTLIEILSPLLFAIILVVIRNLVDSETYSHPTYYQLFPINFNFKNGLQEIAWSPFNPHLEKIMNATAKRLNLRLHKAFNNSNALFDYLIKDNVMNLTFAGVHFNDDLYGDRNISDNIEVTIRFPGEARQKLSIRDELIVPNWRTNLLFPLYQTPGPRNKDDNDGGYSAGYNQEGFLALQDSVLRSIILYLAGNKSLDIPDIRLQRFPYPAYIDDVLLPVLKTFISMIIMLSFSFVCVNSVKTIVSEKEKRLKIVSKIMGLSSQLLWLSWFIKFFIYALISDLLIVILLKSNSYSSGTLSVLPNTSISFLYCFILLYTCAIITFCFMISACFQSANSGAMFSGLAWFFTYAPYLFTERKYDMLSLSQKLFYSLGLNSAMGFGFHLIVNSEGINQGMNWSTLWTPLTPDDTLVMGHVVLMLVFDTLLYLLIAVYIENIFPGPYGVPNPWYFLFSKRYWHGTRKTINIDSANFTSNSYFEEDLTDKEIGIEICSVSKKYNKNTLAVNDLSMVLNKGQISVLLGHNGAGKTTIISILMGLLPPSKGIVLINKYDVYQQLQKVQNQFGVCLQDNVLFDELTVQEHLEFFTRLKEFSKTLISEEVRKYLLKFDLLEKANVIAKNLSGGMKRKLCVALALCGDSKYVFLDEPTAGIDPDSRRHLWSILEEEKKDRTILLSTHYMDEADVIGDKIGILMQGKLQCYGSPYFLKKKFGVGYHFTVEIHEKASFIKINNFIQGFVNQAYLKNRAGSELIYMLPSDSIEYFQVLFENLETSATQLGILSYGLSFATLEDVFIEIGQSDSNVSNERDNSAIHTSYNDVLLQDNLFSDRFKLTGLPLCIIQAKAMFLKHFISTRRLWFLVLLQWLIVASNLIITVHTIRNMYGNKNLPPLEISLDTYNVSYNVFQALNNNKTSRFVNTYVQEYSNVNKKQFLVNVSGIGIENYILQKCKENLFSVRLRYLTGISFLNDIIVWFNNLPYHTAPLTLLMIYNSILKTLIGPNYSFKLINYPLPFDLNSQKLLQGNTTGFQMAFNIGFHMAFVAAFYILFSIREQVSGFKHLQLISGLKRPIFRLCAFVNDYILLCLTLFILFGTLWFFKLDGFSNFYDLLRLTPLYLLFFYAILPVSYLFAFMFRTPSTGYSIMSLLYIITGVICFIIIELLLTPTLKLDNLAKHLNSIFLAFPHYALINGILNLNLVYSSHNICKFFCKDNEIYWEAACLKFNKCCDRTPIYFSWQKPGIAQNLVMLALTGTVSFIILLIYESNYISMKIREMFDFKNTIESYFMDNDVTKEKEIVENLSQDDLQNTSLVLKNLTKYYGKLKAVDQLNLVLNEYECFGLLGKNGAGKSSTFQMLTGEQTITNGNAWLAGLKLSSHLKHIQRKIGYCPQFDVFLNEFTGKDILNLFIKIRGFKFDTSDSILKKYAEKFGFLEHLNKQIKHFSGGNKRKLSISVAFLGNPIVVYLDEPTAGMDPVAKRIVWRVICDERDNGRCIMLTSHSIEECEALCTRLAIMVNGQFKCLGSSQHLKSKFSVGYSLKIKLHKNSINNVQEIKDFVNTKFANVKLTEMFDEMLVYHISDKELTYSELFSIMNNAKDIFHFDDYIISQTSLEQIFLMFTHSQRPVIN